MKGLLISNGDIIDYNILKDLINKHDYIVCADGGINHLIHINKIPNVLIGDLDSINKRGLEFVEKHNINTVKYPSMKDKTDTELSISYMINHDIKDITLIGVTGTRMDHTISNILLLKELNERKIKSRIIDNHNIIYFVNKFIKIRKRKDVNISIIPLSTNGITVYLKGFLYSLKNENIKFGSTLGISNKIIDKYGIIEIKKGNALIIESKD